MQWPLKSIFFIIDYTTRHVHIVQLCTASKSRTFAETSGNQSQVDSKWLCYYFGKTDFSVIQDLRSFKNAV